LIKERIAIQQLRIFSSVIIMILSLLLPNSTYASSVIERTILVDDSPKQSSIIIRNNYQMVPAVWFENLSADVSWSKQYRSASIMSDNQTVIGFPVGQSFTDYDLNGLNEWERDNLDTTNFIHEGRMYVPLAYTARKLGMKVTYDAHSQSTSIQSASRTASKQSISSDDLHWLYQITEAEAGGESYNGKLAVAATILNRVDSPDWPNSIKKTIFQVTKFNGVSYHQFSPVLDNRIYDVTPSKDTVKAVQAALKGEDPSKGAVVFYNPDKTDNKWVRSREVTVIIGNHIFAK
jgi:hypothetical protein